MLYVFGAIPKEDIALLCPSWEVGNAFWWLISGISMILSLLCWEALKRFKLTRICIGQDRDFGNTLSHKLAIKNDLFKKVIIYGWTIYMIVICVQQINPTVIYNEWKMTYTNACTVDGMYEDNFLGKNANVRYTATSDAVVDIQLYQTEYTKENILRVYAEEELLGEYLLIEGSNQIQVPVKEIQNGELQLVFEKSFIPAEVSDSSDAR